MGSSKINLYLNIAILGLIFVSVISTALTNIFVGLVILLWLLEDSFKEKFSKLKTLDKSLIFFISIYVLDLISLLWSDSIYSGGYWSGYHKNAIDFFLRHEFFYLFVIIVIYTSFRKDLTDKAINTFIYAMLLSEIVSYGIIFGLWTTHRGTPSNPSPFLNHSAYSALLAWAIFLLIEKGIKTKNFIKKIIFFIFSITATLNLLLNTGRTGQLIFIILLIFYLIYKFRLKFKIIFLAIFFVFSLFSINYFFNPTFKKRVNEAYSDIVLIKNGKYNSSWGGRYLSILLSKKCLETNPILGYGFADAKKEVFEELKKYDKNSVTFYKKNLNCDMHNQYLQIFNEIGLVGLILLLLTFYFYFKIDFDDNVKIFAYLFMIDYIFMFFTGAFLRVKATFILFIIFTTIFVLNKKNKNNNYNLNNR